MVLTRALETAYLHEFWAFLVLVFSFGGLGNVFGLFWGSKKYPPGCFGPEMAAGRKWPNRSEPEPVELDLEPEPSEPEPARVGSEPNRTEPSAS